MARRREKFSFKKSVWSSFLYGAAALLALLVLWLVAYILTANEYLVPSPKDTFFETVALLRESAFYTAFFETFLRCLTAFLVSFFCAVCVAIVSYLLKPIEKIAALFVATLRSLPTMAIILLILVWSSPKKAPVVVAFLALFPMLYTGVLSALCSIDVRYKKVCEVYEVPLYRRVFSMYFPLVLPQVIREGAGGLSFSIKLVVSAEIMANTFKSLGGMLQEAKIYLELPRLFALTLIVVLTGIVTETIGNALAALSERRLR